MKRILMLVENLPSPFDRRVWQEATTLHQAGYEVSIICPTGHGYERRHEVLEGIHIYRYRLPVEAAGAAGYAIEYAIALTMTFALTCKVLFTRGFDAIHACNPPDLFFLIGGFFKLFGRIPDADMLALLNAADICVNPDIANDMNDKSTMNKIMEYMALGRARVINELAWDYEAPKLLTAYKMLWPATGNNTSRQVHQTTSGMNELTSLARMCPRSRFGIPILMG